MKHKIIVNTGPLVAFINRRDQYHEWIKIQLAAIKPPLLTCEAVISEACFLLRNMKDAQESLLECIHRQLILLSIDLNEEVLNMRKLMTRYEGVPMSLADACLVRMAEQINDSRILTLDSNFHIYQKNNRQVIPVLMPE